jgi:hypothetical protein
MFNKIAQYFLFFLFALYYAQDWLYETGSTLSQLCLVIIILISGIYMVKTFLLNDRKNLFFFAWTFFIFLNLIGFVFNPDFSEGPVRDAIKNTLGCMLPFYPFYYFARKGTLKTVHLIGFVLLILPIIIFRYFTNASQILIERSNSDKDLVNNLAYMFVSILPFVFLIKKRIISVLMMLLVVMFVIQGAKRGAIIASSIGLAMYFYYQIKTVEKQKRIVGYLSVILVIIILTAFAYITSMSNDFMLNRMTSILEGDTSNRTYIYTSVFNNWYKSDNIINLMFGYGIAGSLMVSGDLAHNDWLEVLSNFGLTGVFAYILLFYSAFKSSLTREWMLDKRILMFTILCMWFFITLVSMWYTSLDYYANSILFGYLLGNKNKSLE